MSDLIISPKGIPAPPKPCSQEPPKPVPDQETKDACFFELPLEDQKAPGTPSKLIRFDRRGDQFVLSNHNSSDSLTWIAKYGDLKDILIVARLLEQIYQGFAEVKNADEHAAVTMIAQFVVTGRIRFPDGVPFKEDASGKGSKIDLANYLLAIFNVSPPGGVQKLLGTLTLFRRDQDLGEAGRERVDWINSLVDLVPKHRAFRKNFIGSYKVDPWREIPEPMQEILRPILYFSRKAVVYDWMKLDLPWDQDFLEAFLGFQNFHSMLEEETLRKSFCQAIQKAEKELSGAEVTLTGKCQRALLYAPLKSEATLRESFLTELFTEEGFAGLQDLVAAESARSNMTVDWLQQRGRLFAVAKVIFHHVDFSATPQQGLPRLKIDAAGMIRDLRLNLTGHFGTRREFLLSTLAVMRYYFGLQEAPPAVPVFWNFQYTKALWDMDADSRKQIRKFIVEIEKQLKHSQKNSDLWLPLAEGAACAAGTAGALAMEKWGDPDSKFQRKLTWGGYLGAGGGCGALVGHYLLPRVLPGKVRNRYFWDGASGLGGAIIGSGLYFLIHSFLSPYQDPTRNPVDEYGP